MIHPAKPSTPGNNPALCGHCRTPHVSVWQTLARLPDGLAAVLQTRRCKIPRYRPFRTGVPCFIAGRSPGRFPASPRACSRLPWREPLPPPWPRNGSTAGTGRTTPPAAHPSSRPGPAGTPSRSGSWCNAAGGCTPSASSPGSARAARSTSGTMRSASWPPRRTRSRAGSQASTARSIPSPSGAATAPAPTSAGPSRRVHGQVSQEHRQGQYLHRRGAGAVRPPRRQDGRDAGRARTRTCSPAASSSPSTVPARNYYASLNSRTGRDDRYLRLSISGHYHFSGVHGNRTRIYNQQISPTGQRLLVEGDFTRVHGKHRQQIFMLTLRGSQARVTRWRSTEFNRNVRRQRAVLRPRRRPGHRTAGRSTSPPTARHPRASP